MRFALDSNILVYAVDTGTPARHDIARHIVERALQADAVLVTQTIGDFLSVFSRKYPNQLVEARAAAALWVRLLPLADSTGDDVIASGVALDHKLQYWDSLILVVAANAGAEYFVSEDMQNGMTVDGLTVVNPFNPANTTLIDLLLSPMISVERP